MTFLIDTNIISELRKEQRADRAVLKWIASTVPEEHHTSVLVIGEMRRGVERMRRRDAAQANVLERWLHGMIDKYRGRILPVDARIADAWGRMGIPDPIPDIDGILAATALVHNLTVVTRDAHLLALKSIRSLNPFMQ